MLVTVPQFRVLVVLNTEGVVGRRYRRREEARHRLHVMRELEGPAATAGIVIPALSTTTWTLRRYGPVSSASPAARSPRRASKIEGSPPWPERWANYLPRFADYP
jgi:hypothetical protein